MVKLGRVFTSGIFAVLFCAAVYAQPANDKANSKAVEFWSEGTRLAGDLFWPKDAAADTKLPAIVLCHGWGGVKSHLNATYAPDFAAAGFVVLAFDYRGWGESDSVMIAAEGQPKPDSDGTATVKVRYIRELVTPFGQLEDIRNAINFIEGEPMADRARIGIWGTSFGGGLVVWTAAHDPRVKCVVSQVGAQDARSAAGEIFAQSGGIDALHEREIRRTRGGLPPVPQGEDLVENLRGTPHMEEFMRYAPVDHAKLISVPILFIDAENEELFDRMQHSAKVYEIVKDRVPAKYHVEPGIQHYGIYRERYRQGADLAIEWFNTHLK